MAKFQMGDAVMLKSGGLTMTVEGYSLDGNVLCVWFEKEGVHRGSFPEEVLVKAEMSDEEFGVK